MNFADSNPLALIAELTHRCPLHCVYCSNPLELRSRANELDTQTWSRVFREAAELGVLQADFTGGEPLARTDIVDLVRAPATPACTSISSPPASRSTKPGSTPSSPPASIICSSASRARARKSPRKFPAQSPTHKNFACSSG